MWTMRSMCSTWSTKPEISTDFANGVTLSAALGKVDSQHHGQFPDIAEDDHVDGVELLDLVPQVDLRHARRLGRNLNLGGRQRGHSRISGLLTWACGIFWSITRIRLV